LYNRRSRPSRDHLPLPSLPNTDPDPRSIPLDLGQGPGEAGLLSVVLPTYQRAYIVGRAIESVLAQTHRPVEVVVVDDGSTDDTRAVVKRYGPEVRYIHQTNGGVSRARNTGLRAARGEFIGLLDSDDVWLPWKAEVQVSFLRRFPEIGMVWTEMSAVDVDGTMVQSEYLQTYYGAYGKTRLADWMRPLGRLGEHSVPGEHSDRKMWGGDLFSAMFFGNLVHTSTVLLRRERLRLVGGFDESLRPIGEDYDFHWRTTREGPVGYLDAPTILYRITAPDQISNHTHGYGLPLARNNFRTLERFLRADGPRIALTPAAVRQHLAEAHGWLGEELLLAGLDGSTGHIARSLRVRPGQPRLAFLFLFSLLPRPAFRTALWLKQTAAKVGRLLQSDRALALCFLADSWP
jgi:glycosyltransferase involved in cell wall biosynthesis